MTLSTETYRTGTFVGRVWRPDVQGPALVVVRDGVLFDITSRQTATMRDLLELDEPAAYVAAQTGEELGPLDTVLAQSVESEADAARLVNGIDRGRFCAQDLVFLSVRKLHIDEASEIALREA